jgi:hypothetical protein
MSKQDIIRMAREAKLNIGPAGMGQTVWGGDADLERFAALVAAVERERAAKVCEDVHAGKYDAPEFWREGVAYTCAAVIRKGDTNEL